MVYFRNISRYVKGVLENSIEFEGSFYYRCPETTGNKTLLELGILGEPKKFRRTRGYAANLYHVDMDKAGRCLRRLQEIAEQNAATYGRIRGNVNLDDLKTE